MSTYTREQLYEMVWAEPVRTVAARFGISDVGLKKHCKKLDIPVPERGYWAKRDAGKRVIQTKLPPRRPGAPDTTSLGPEPAYSWRCDPAEVLAQPLPEQPIFTEPLEAVRERVRNAVRAVKYVRDFESPHPAIRKLIDRDRKLIEKRDGSPYMSTFYQPHFQSGFEQRRLKVLNSILLGMRGWDGGADFRGDDARDIAITTGAARFDVRLDHPSAKPNRHGVWGTRSGPADTLDLVILEPTATDSPKRWSDTSDQKLEKQLTEIVIEFLVEAEASYRRACHRHYERELERRARAEADLERQRIEAERAAREKRLKEERAAQRSLLRQARAHRKANDIRTFVELVRGREPGDKAVDEWAHWALGVADRLDPMTHFRIEDGAVRFSPREEKNPLMKDEREPQHT